MRFVVVVLLALTGAASAQNWEPGGGWDVPGLDSFEERRRQMHVDHERRVAEMNREFEASKAKSEREFQTFSLVVYGLMGLIVVGGIAGAILASRGQRRRPRDGIVFVPDEPVAPRAFASAGTVDVTAMRIGIDGRASKFVRTELEAIARTYASDDAETRARKLREVSIMLRRVRDSWIYGGVDNEPMRPRGEALAAFDRLVDDARTRGHKGDATNVPTSTMPVSLILVSVIVAARGELMTVTDLATGEDLRRALEAATHRAPDEILKLEVVWVPDRENDRVSSIELERVYRRAELHPLEGVTVGKVFCTYCNGPFPGELVSCPHCGGPAPGRERAA